MYSRPVGLAGGGATAGALAFTGSNLALYIAIGLVFVISGACLIRLARIGRPKARRP